jgi:hypothetical protein
VGRLASALYGLLSASSGFPPRLTKALSYRDVWQLLVDFRRYRRCRPARAGTETETRLVLISIGRCSTADPCIRRGRKPGRKLIVERMHMCRKEADIEGITYCPRARFLPRPAVRSGNRRRARRSSGHPACHKAFASQLRSALCPESGEKPSHVVVVLALLQVKPEGGFGIRGSRSSAGATLDRQCVPKFGRKRGPPLSYRRPSPGRSARR